MTCDARNRRSYMIVLIVGLGLLRPSQGVAQPVDLLGDRPDQTESAETVAPGTIQFELGWLHVRDKQDNVKVTTSAFPETLIRYGLIENVELRFGSTGYLWEQASPEGEARESNDGFGDIEIGLKWKLLEEDGWMPQTAILPSLSLPTGTRAFSSRRVDPSIRLAFAHTLTETLDLGYNLAGIWETQEDGMGGRDTTTLLAYSTALGIALSDRIGAFVEVFGSTPTDGGKPANSFDAGLTYLVHTDLQLDVFAGVGLSDAADDWFLGAGLVYRIRDGQRPARTRL